MPVSADLVEVRLQDYREVTGQFDAVVSVEMIEAVGEEYWPTYFRQIDSLLAPGGAVAIQAILMEHHRLVATKGSFGWIQKYIFPGGLIPSLQAIREVTRDTPTCGSSGVARLRAATTPRRCAGGGSTFLERVARHPRPGFRRDLPADVGVLPRLL